MRILVIGGAGYIGSHVVHALLENGHAVRVLDDMSTGQEINLVPGVEFIKGSILDTNILEKSMTDIDGVVHLAAKKAAGESMIDPVKYATNNINGTINVLNAMAKTGVKKFVFSSTAAVYGNPEYPVLDEKHPLKPINFYGMTKLEIERFLEWYDKLCGIKFVALRYFNAVGYDAAGRVKGLEKNPQNLLPVIMETAIGIRPEMAVFGNDYDTRDGTCIRDYIHVTDLADAHVRALDYLNKDGGSQSLNLGTGTGHSVLEMIQATERLLDMKLNYHITARREGDPTELRAASQKAYDLLGWSAKHSDLDNMILTTYAVYKNQN